MNKENLIKFLEKNANIEIECLPEHMPVKGSFDSGDEKLDIEQENKIYAELESGNQWAWCTVHVIAKYRGFMSDNYLGGCNYESENQFRDDDYYKSMLDLAIQELAETIISAKEGLTELENKILNEVNI